MTYGRSLDLEEDLYEKAPETLGRSYATLDKEVVESLENHYEKLTPQEFVGDGAKTDEGTVFYDAENGKAAYVKIKPHSRDIVLFSTHFFGDEDGVASHLLEEREEKLGVDEAVTAEQDMSLSTGADREVESFSPSKDSRGMDRYRGIERIE
jgi:hypothetical protein